MSSRLLLLLWAAAQSLCLLLCLLGATEAAGPGFGTAAWAPGVHRYSRKRGLDGQEPSLLQLRDIDAWPWRKRAPKEIGQWGYVPVRPKAHMFWWLQAKNQEPLESSNPETPLVVWLQGGPGASGTGFGQFTEIGPYDTEWNRRQHSWTDEAHVLFLDNPVGTGFSYVEEGGKFAKDNSNIGLDLYEALKGVLKALPELQGAPITIVCESYGGKMGVALAKEVLLGGGGSPSSTPSDSSSVPKINLQGLALGDSWIHPVDYVLAWGPLLSDVSLLDSSSYEAVMEAALDIANSANKGQWVEAAEGWGKMEAVIEKLTDNVNFYNFLQHNVPDVSAASPELMSLWQQQPPAAFPGNETAAGGGGSADPATIGSAFQEAKVRHLSAYHNGALADFMNGEVRDALGDVIPRGVQWGSQSGLVFEHLKADFMVEVVPDVDKLLAAGLNVTIYSGQLDLICCTRGTEMWLKKLNWPHMDAFYTASREPLYVPGDSTGTKSTGAFRKRHKNLAMYYIMSAGHMVPSDQPEVAILMLRSILGL